MTDLQRLLDIEEVKRMKAAYGRLLDGFTQAVRPADVKALADLFSEDVVAEFSDLLRGLNDYQLRHQPKEGLNSIAWYLWHTSRWQDLRLIRFGGRFSYAA